MSKYRIAWKCSESGRRKVGTKTFSLEEAQRICNELNLTHPHIEHVPVPDDQVELPRFKSDDPVILPTVAALTDSAPMPFGEYKGKPMAKVPSTYLDWLQGQADLMAAWPQIDAYISHNRKAIDQDLVREGFE